MYKVNFSKERKFWLANAVRQRLLYLDQYIGELSERGAISMVEPAEVEYQTLLELEKELTMHDLVTIKMWNA